MKTKFNFGRTFLLVLLCHSLAYVNAQKIEQSIYPPNLTYAFRFGHEVKVDDNTMLIVDRGYKPSSGNYSCGSIDDGAVHIYKRNNTTDPWPSSPSQTLVSETREGHFGQYTFIKNNTMIVTEERARVNGVWGTGKINYYKRYSPYTDFFLVDDVVAPANVTYFPSSGCTSNGNYVVALANSYEPNIHVYRISANTIDFVYSITGSSLYNIDNIAITDNDILILNKKDTNSVRLVKLNPTSFTDINTNALTLTNTFGLSNNIYSATLATEGNHVVLVAQGEKSGQNHYYLKSFDLSNETVQNVKNVLVPGFFSEENQYEIARNSIAFKHDDAIFVSFLRNQTPLSTLAFHYVESLDAYTYTGAVNIRHYTTQAGTPFKYLGANLNYDHGMAYDGENLYIGDPYDKTNEDFLPQGCAKPQGAVHIFNFEAPITTIGNFTRFTDMAYQAKSDNEFGYSVAIHDDYMIVGQQSDDDLPPSSTNDGIGRNSGAAYLYQKVSNEWKRISTFIDNEGDSYSLLGASVAINDAHLAVGAPRDRVNNQNSGSVLTATKVNGSFLTHQPLVTKITPPDHQNNANFGVDISLDGDILAVGAPEFGGSDDDGGSVYTYHWNGSTWVYDQKINALDSIPNQAEHFGTSVAVSGNIMIVGAIGKEATGSIYFFEKTGNNWVQTHKFTAPSSSGITRFGTRVALSGNYAVASDPTANSNDGFVQFYYYNGTQWVLEQSINGSLGLNRQFGASLAIEGDHAIISSAASVQLQKFERQGTTWVDQGITTVPGHSTAFYRSFGVDLDGDQIVVGKGAERLEGTTGQGAAYITSYASITGTTQDPFTVNVNTNEWNSGASVNVSITNNTSSVVNNWSVSFQWPNIAVTGSWNCVYSEYNDYRTFSNTTNNGGNGTIQPGSIASYGFNLSKTGTLVVPDYATVNNVTVPVLVNGNSKKGLETEIPSTNHFYPNPVEGNRINFTSSTITKASLHTLSGESVAELTISNGTAILPAIAKGMYILVLHQKDGETIREKFIKK